MDIKKLNEYIEHNKEEFYSNMKATEIKPIRPTQVIVSSEKEYRDFIAFAEGRETFNIEAINKVCERLANHQRSPKRK